MSVETRNKDNVANSQLEREQLGALTREIYNFFSFFGAPSQKSVHKNILK